MNVYDLIEKLGGEVVRDRARVNHEGKTCLVGRVTPEGMVMTEEGKRLVDKVSAPKPTPAKKKAKKPAAAAPAAAAPVVPTPDAPAPDAAAAAGLGDAE